MDKNKGLDKMAEHIAKQKFADEPGIGSDLTAEQEKSLGTPTLPANPVLRLMIFALGVIYGSGRSLLKLKSIEILARYPYQAWENSTYHRLTRAYARRAYSKKNNSDYHLHIIDMSRKSQDNEQFHMMIIEDIMRQQGVRQGIFKAQIAPRVLAFFYLGFTRILYGLSPKWSFSMNARFESHAEHEYMLMAKEHPEWENQAVTTDYFEYYPKQATLANLFRQIALDERHHKEESVREWERLSGKKFA